MAISFGSVE